MLCHKLLKTKILLNLKVVEVAEVGLEAEVVEVEGRGGLILCYWCRDFLPKEQANHKVANCPYQNQARDNWWKSQLGNGATLPTRFVPSPVENLSGNAQQEEKENC